MLVDVLLDRFDIVDFLQSHGYNLKHIGGATGYLTNCPFCLKKSI